MAARRNGVRSGASAATGAEIMQAFADTRPEANGKLAAPHRDPGHYGLDLKASATIDGAVTNRVVVKKQPKARRVKYRAYQADPAVHGRPYTTVTFSIPIDDLEALDEACRRAQMSRSRFLRQAGKHFAEGIKP